MKLFTLILTFFLVTENLVAQHMGINTTMPLTALHIKSSGENTLTVENGAILNSNVKNSILFAHAIESSTFYKYTGAIKTIGTGIDEARLGFYTYANNSPGGMTERLSILNNGNVGIATTNPTYRFQVTGSTYLNGYVGIGTAASTSYDLSVGGASRFHTDLRIDGVLNPNTTLNIGDNAIVEGTLSVLNGKGIVRSTSSTQMKIKRASVVFGYSGLGAGSTATSGNLNFGEDFAAVTVTVGQCVSGTGDWAKVMIVPCNVDLNANTCQFAITNVSSSTISFDGSWQIVLVGN